MCFKNRSYRCTCVLRGPRYVDTSGTLCGGWVSSKVLTCGRAAIFIRPEGVSQLKSEEKMEIFKSLWVSRFLSTLAVYHRSELSTRGSFIWNIRCGQSTRTCLWPDLRVILCEGTLRCQTCVCACCWDCCNHLVAQFSFFRLVLPKLIRISCRPHII